MRSRRWRRCTRSRAASSPTTFVNLDMEEYKDLDLTIAVFTRLLERPTLRGYAAGIVLQAYLPDALGAMIRLQEWAAARVAAGGAPIKVRVVKGANLPMESVDAELHGWPLATWGTKRDTDASYKSGPRLRAPAPSDTTRACTGGVAGQPNLFDRGDSRCSSRRLRRAVNRGHRHRDAARDGIGAGRGRTARRRLGLLLITRRSCTRTSSTWPIAYLIRRLEEGASSENFMSAVFDLDDPKMFRPRA